MESYGRSCTLPGKTDTINSDLRKTINECLLMDETELYKKLRQGDADAFKHLLFEYQSRIINTCYRFVHNREDAEDIAQEVFLEVYKSVGKFREQAKLSTWMYRIAVTKSLDFLRNKNRKKRFSSIRKVFESEKVLKRIPGPDNMSPDKILERDERYKILFDTIHTLPENQKIAFTLSKIEALQNKEIADIMSTSVSSVESLIHRAKKNLRKKLFKYYRKNL